MTPAAAEGTDAPDLERVRHALVTFIRLWQRASRRTPVPRDPVCELAAHLQEGGSGAESTLRLLETDLEKHLPPVHAINVARLAIRVARSLSYGEEDVRELAVAALLHDIGKASLEDAVPEGTRNLTRSQTRAMHRHPGRGAAILSETRGLELSMVVAYEHHMTRQGGYPTVREDRRPHVATRLIQVCDVVDARRSGHGEDGGPQLGRVLDYLRCRTGSHYDPGFVGALDRSLRDVLVASVSAPGSPCALCQIGDPHGTGVAPWPTPPPSEDSDLKICRSCRELLDRHDLGGEDPVSCLVTLVSRGEIDIPSVEDLVAHRAWPELWRHSPARSGVEVSSDEELERMIREFLQSSPDPHADSPPDRGDDRVAASGGSAEARRGAEPTGRRVEAGPTEVVQPGVAQEAEEVDLAPVREEALSLWRCIRDDPDSADFMALRQACADARLHDPVEQNAVYRRAVQIALGRQQYGLALRACNSLLRTNYLDPAAHVWVAGALAGLARDDGIPNEAVFHRKLSAALLSAVRGTGDGNSPETAYRPISMPELHVCLYAEGPERVDPPSVFDLDGSRFHRHPIVDGSPESRPSLYFRVGWSAGDGDEVTGSAISEPTARRQWRMALVLRAKGRGDRVAAATQLDLASKIVRTAARTSVLSADEADEMLDIIATVRAS